MATAISAPLTPDVHARHLSRLSPGATFRCWRRSSFRFWPGRARPPRSTRCTRPSGVSRHHHAVVFGVSRWRCSALLTVGSLSDYVGRRPVLLVAIAMQAVTMLLFTTAHSVPDLIAARVLQGLSAGGALGALGAG